MNPQEFQTIALQWIAVILAVTLSAIGAFFGIWNAIQNALNKQREQNNAARLDRHGESIKTLLLESPAKSESKLESKSQ